VLHGLLTHILRPEATTKKSAGNFLSKTFQPLNSSPKRIYQDNMAAPLALNDTYQGSFECFTCCKKCTCPPHQPWQMPGGEMVCAGCILPFFEAALKFDHHWPAEWAGKVLRIEDFASILGPEFLARLLWKRTAMEIEAERLAGLNPSGMEGQVRGTDYQYCPTCKRPIALKDGCNHVTCKCGENFCFKCGEFADGDSSHWEWNVGCPRWGNEHLPENEEFEEDDEMYSATAWRINLIRMINEFSLGYWAWNVAMQNSDLELRGVMQHFAAN
jgi:hypothetical protein